MTKKRSSIIVPSEIKQKMADRDAGKIQAFTNELGQVQSRRLELTTMLLQAAVTHSGLPKTDVEATALAKEAAFLANEAVALDCREKWSALRDLFAEMKFEGPQPHLEWAAKQVGVTLFEESEILEPSADEIAKVIQ